MHEIPFVSDASDADFQEKVLQRSRTVPVLIDFWASWCGPCKTLTPILEKLATEYDGAFELVKIDTEKNPQVSAALRVQSVPTVYLVKDGQPVDGFQGAQPESAVRALLDRHVEAPAQDPMIAAEEALAQGHIEDAARQFQMALDSRPTHGEALLGLARVAMMQGDPNGAAAWVDRIAHEDPCHDRARRLLGAASFGQDAGNEVNLRARIDANRDDVEAWFSLGATMAVANEFAEAFSAFLQVVELDREYREDGARKALLSLFDVVGPEDPTVITARRRLASLLF
jgi:putative thioredoxin